MAGEDLRRESFIQLDQVDIVEGKPGSIEQLANRRHRTDPHECRIDPGIGPGHQASHRLHAMSIGRGGGHDDHGRRPVDDAGGRAGMNGALLAENRR